MSLNVVLSGACWSLAEMWAPLRAIPVSMVATQAFSSVRIILGPLRMCLKKLLAQLNHHVKCPNIPPERRWHRITNRPQNQLTSDLSTERMMKRTPLSKGIVTRVIDVFPEGVCVFSYPLSVPTSAEIYSLHAGRKFGHLAPHEETGQAAKSWDLAWTGFWTQLPF